MLLSIPLVPLMAHAGTDDGAPPSQVQEEAKVQEETKVQEEAKLPVAAATTVGSGETAPAGVDANLRPTQQLKDAAASTDFVRSETALPPSTPRIEDDLLNAKSSARSSHIRTVEEMARDARNAKTSAPSTSNSSNSSDSEASARSAPKATKAKTKSARTPTPLPRHTSNVIDYAHRDHGAMPSMSNTAIEVQPGIQLPLALDAKSLWKIRAGERLSEVFARWSKVVGWQIAWEPEDLIALADLEVEDTFTGITGKVIDALNRNGADMQAKFYASNHMLRIMARK